MLKQALLDNFPSTHKKYVLQSWNSVKEESYNVKHSRFITSFFLSHFRKCYLTRDCTYKLEKGQSNLMQTVDLNRPRLGKLRRGTGAL